MLNKFKNIKDIKDKYEYYELPDHKFEGSFIIIENNANFITVKIDRYSTIPFYYYIFKGEFYGSTSLQNLIDNKPSEFKISLNESFF